MLLSLLLHSLACTAPSEEANVPESNCSKPETDECLSEFIFSPDVETVKNGADELINHPNRIKAEHLGRFKQLAQQGDRNLSDMAFKIYERDAMRVFDPAQKQILGADFDRGLRLLDDAVNLGLKQFSIPDFDALKEKCRLGTGWAEEGTRDVCVALTRAEQVCSEKANGASPYEGHPLCVNYIAKK